MWNIFNRIVFILTHTKNAKIVFGLELFEKFTFIELNITSLSLSFMNQICYYTRSFFFLTHTPYKIKILCEKKRMKVFKWKSNTSSLIPSRLTSIGFFFHHHLRMSSNFSNAWKKKRPWFIIATSIQFPSQFQTMWGKKSREKIASTPTHTQTAGISYRCLPQHFDGWIEKRMKN